MVLEIVISESTIRIVLVVLMWVLTIIAVYFMYKMDPVQTFFGLLFVGAILTIWCILWLWGTYIAPLYSITVVP